MRPSPAIAFSARMEILDTHIATSRWPGDIALLRRGRRYSSTNLRRDFGGLIGYIAHTQRYTVFPASVAAFLEMQNVKCFPTTGFMKVPVFLVTLFQRFEGEARTVLSVMDWFFLSSSNTLEPRQSRGRTCKNISVTMRVVHFPCVGVSMIWCHSNKFKQGVTRRILNINFSRIWSIFAQLKGEEA